MFKHIKGRIRKSVLRIEKFFHSVYALRDSWIYAKKVFSEETTFVKGERKVQKNILKNKGNLG